jgi:hypothetical protein
MKSILENCADKRAWEGTRIGNLSRKDAVSLLGERVVAELDKKPFYVNCPQASDTSYTDPDASDNRNPDIEHYASVACKEKHGRNIGTLIRVQDCSREHYLFDRIERLARKQKIKAIVSQIQSNSWSITQNARENERLATQLKRLLKQPKAK